MSSPVSFSLKQIAVPAFGPSLLHGVATGAALPVIAFSAGDLGATPAVAGFVVALTGIGSLVNNVPAALLTQRFGERLAMVAAALAAIVPYTLCIVAHRVWLLAAGVLLAGMAGAVFVLARQTWLIAVVPYPMRARALSTLAGSMRIGVFIGPFAGAGLIVVPLWADAIGLTPAAASVVYGLSALVDMAVFYPSGQVMDRRGRIWVAVPSTTLMALALLAMPLTAGYAGFLAAALLLGLGNGIGSGIVMTLGADASPREGRTPFLGIWRMMADLGTSAGPLLLSAITAVTSLATGIAATGVLGLIAAAIFWVNLPRRRWRDR